MKTVKRKYKHIYIYNLNMRYNLSKSWPNNTHVLHCLCAAASFKVWTSLLLEMSGTENVWNWKCLELEMSGFESKFRFVVAFGFFQSLYTHREIYFYYLSPFKLKGIWS